MEPRRWLVKVPSPKKKSFTPISTLLIYFTYVTFHEECYGSWISCDKNNKKISSPYFSSSYLIMEHSFWEGFNLSDVEYGLSMPFYLQSIYDPYFPYGNILFTLFSPSFWNRKIYVCERIVKEELKNLGLLSLLAYKPFFRVLNYKKGYLFECLWNFTNNFSTITPLLKNF